MATVCSDPLNLMDKQAKKSLAPNNVLPDRNEMNEFRRITVSDGSVQCDSSGYNVDSQVRRPAVREKTEEASNGSLIECKTTNTGEISKERQTYDAVTESNASDRNESSVKGKTTVTGVQSYDKIAKESMMERKNTTGILVKLAILNKLKSFSSYDVATNIAFKYVRYEADIGNDSFYYHFEGGNDANYTTNIFKILINEDLPCLERNVCNSHKCDVNKVCYVITVCNECNERDVNKYYDDIRVCYVRRIHDFRDLFINNAKVCEMNNLTDISDKVCAGSSIDGDVLDSKDTPCTGDSSVLIHFTNCRYILETSNACKDAARSDHYTANLLAFGNASTLGLIGRINHVTRSTKRDLVSSIENSSVNTIVLFESTTMHDNLNYATPRSESPVLLVTNKTGIKECYCQRQPSISYISHCLHMNTNGRRHCKLTTLGDMEICDERAEEKIMAAYLAINNASGHVKGRLRHANVYTDRTTTGSLNSDHPDDGNSNALLNYLRSNENEPTRFYPTDDESIAQGQPDAKVRFANRLNRFDVCITGLILGFLSSLRNHSSSFPFVLLLVFLIMPLNVLSQSARLQRLQPRLPSDEERLLELLFDGYNPSARPVINSSHTVGVRMEFSLLQIQDLDLRSQVLTTTGLLILEWQDERLQWRQSEIPLKDVVIEAKMLWRPEFASINGADGIYGDYGNFRAIIKSNGMVHWEPGGIFKTICEIDITYYPFDEQRCTLQFGAWSYHTTKMNLSNTDSRVNMDSFEPNGEWEITATEAKREEFSFECCPNEKFSFVRFTVVLKRRYTFYIMNVILPSLMTSVLLLSIFFCTPAQKVQIGVVVLLSFRIFLLNVTDSIPKTSDHIPLLGIYLTCTMAITTLSMVLTVFVLNLHHVTDRPVPLWAKKVILVWLARLLCMCAFEQAERLREQEEAEKNKFRVTSKTFGNAIGNQLGLIASLNGTLGVASSTTKNKSYGSTANRPRNVPSINLNLDQHDSNFRSQYTYGIDDQKNKIDPKKQEEEWAREWRRLAEVVDRLFFWLFLSAIVISTLLLFHPLTKSYFSLLGDETILGDKKPEQTPPS